MGTLFFVGPATGHQVSTGVEIDAATFKSLDSTAVRCPHCHALHRISGIRARIAEADELTHILPDGFNGQRPSVLNRPVQEQEPGEIIVVGKRDDAPALRRSRHHLPRAQRCLARDHGPTLGVGRLPLKKRSRRWSRTRLSLRRPS